MDRPRLSAARARRRRGAPSQAEIRQQLTSFAWLRLIVVTTALFTTLVLHLIIKLDRFADTDTLPLYAVFGLAYVSAACGLVALALLRSPAALAAVQFGGDIVVATALLHVLGYAGAVAFAVALFSVATFLASTYLTRIQGALFATGGFLLQVAVHVSTLLGWLPERTVTGLRLEDSLDALEVVKDLSIFMFTFYATAWLVGSRSERLQSLGDRLQSVTQDLHELQVFSDHVVHGMRSALVTTDPEGRITFANAAAAVLLGAPQAALQGTLLHERLGWLGARADDLRLAREGGGGRVVRDAVLDGQRRWLDASSSRLEGARGEELGLLFLLEDVTDLRELEGEVRTKEKMAAIGEMAAGIAHEIRNPLASISGSIQMLQRSLELDGDQARLMDIVLRESGRLDDTIREFLDFARPRQARPRLVDLSEVVRDTVTLLANSKDVQPHHVLRGPTGLVVEAHVDPDQIRQVAWNLCQNALRAMPSGGELDVDVAADGGEAVLTVADTGVGMSPATRARAFQPLSSEFSGGMGLGLAIVYRIVKDHGGRVSLDSEVGHGTRVEVRLPGRVRVLDAPGDAR